MTEPTFTLKQLQDAFLEGFESGQSHGNLTWKYPPVGVAWLESEARKLTGLPKNHQPLQLWESMKYADRSKFYPPIEALP